MVFASATAPVAADLGLDDLPPLQVQLAGGVVVARPSRVPCARVGYSSGSILSLSVTPMTENVVRAMTFAFRRSTSECTTPVSVT